MKRLGALVVAGLSALGGLAPGGHRVPAARGLALAAAVRVVHRVHGDAAVVRAAAQPALAARLAVGDVLVVEVAHLAHGGHAVHVDLAHLARGQLHLGVVAFLGHELGGPARAPHHLPALAVPQLDVVDHGARGDQLQGQAIAGQDVRAVAGEDGLPDLHALGPEDVALLAVRVVQEGEPGRAVRVVLDGRHLRGDVPLVAAEVHHAVAALVAPAPEPDGGAAHAVPAARALLGLGQALLRAVLRDLLEGEGGHEPPAGRRRVVLLQCHCSYATEAQRTQSEAHRRSSPSPSWLRFSVLSCLCGFRSSACSKNSIIFSSFFRTT